MSRIVAVILIVTNLYMALPFWARSDEVVCFLSGRNIIYRVFNRRQDYG
jgi:hypothetical protein